MTSLSEAKRQGTTPADVVPLAPPTGPVLPPGNQPDAGGTTPLPRFKIKGAWKQAPNGEWYRLTREERQRRKVAANLKRHGKRLGRWRSQPISQREKETIAVMKATGMPNKTIGRALKVSPDTVRNHASTPEVKALIEQWRLSFRAQALEQTQAIQGDAWGRVRDSLERDDSKAFDAYTRGIHAMEKVAASASGENRPVAPQIAILNQVSMSPEERDELLREFKADLLAEDAQQLTPLSK